VTRLAPDHFRPGISGNSAGLTLVEAMMSMVIVAVLLVAALRATGASALAQYKTAERATGRALASGLVNEIVVLRYEDPNGSPVFGREAGESSSSKASWNDVDDFDGWTESPPQYRDGTVMPNLAGWQRTVTVTRINPLNVSQTSVSETGAKQNSVTVKHNGLPVATRVAIRTKVS
jgi:Tfp pilus assembly protein PilV